MFRLEVMINRKRLWLLILASVGVALVMGVSFYAWYYIKASFGDKIIPSFWDQLAYFYRGIPPFTPSRQESFEMPIVFGYERDPVAGRCAVHGLHGTACQQHGQDRGQQTFNGFCHSRPPCPPARAGCGSSPLCPRRGRFQWRYRSPRQSRCADGH